MEWRTVASVFEANTLYKVHLLSIARNVYCRRWLAKLPRSNEKSHQKIKKRNLNFWPKISCARKLMRRNVPSNLKNSEKLLKAVDVKLKVWAYRYRTRVSWSESPLFVAQDMLCCRNVQSNSNFQWISAWSSRYLIRTQANISVTSRTESRSW